LADFDLAIALVFNFLPLLFLPKLNLRFADIESDPSLVELLITRDSCFEIFSSFLFIKCDKGDTGKDSLTPLTHTYIFSINPTSLWKSYHISLSTVFIPIQLPVNCTVESHGNTNGLHTPVKTVGC
jgi:hypothetical protein